MTAPIEIHSPPADPGALHDLAVEMALAAGDYLRGAVGRAKEATTKSSRTDMVTESDRHVEQLIVGMIEKARPDDGLLGEEGADRPSRSGVTWIIDPIDGTTNFFYGLPGFNVSIAAVCEAGTLAGVVLDPLHGDLYGATVSGPATLNGMPIRCSDQNDLSLALVATGFGYAPATRARQAEILLGVMPHIRDIRRFGAAAVDLCLVASGRVDAYFERGLAPWDRAAGTLIARRAGAVVGDFHGGEPSRAFTLAAPRVLWDALRQVLHDAGETGAGDAD